MNSVSLCFKDASHRVSRSVIVGVSALFLALLLAACGGSSPAPQATQSTKPAQAATTQAAVTQAESANDTPTAEDATTSVAPEQVTETDDGAESISDSPPAVATTAGLKLAAASSEPKVTSAFKEGVHYQRLVPTQPNSAPPGEVEVAEMFSYGSPPCFALDPKLEDWRQSKPSYVAFQRVPGAISAVAQIHGRIFYTAELLGKLDELHPLIFREIHLNGNTLNTMDKAKAFFVANGVAPADFDKAFASFKVESKLQNANLLMRRYRVTGIPFFVVNGKFATDIASAGGEEQLLQLLNELAAREHVN